MDLFDKTPEKRGSINIELPSTVKKAATLVSLPQNQKRTANKDKAGSSFLNIRTSFIQQNTVPQNRNINEQQTHQLNINEDGNLQNEGNDKNSLPLKNEETEVFPKKCVFCQRKVNQNIDSENYVEEQTDQQAMDTITNPIGQIPSGIAVTVQEEEIESDDSYQQKMLKNQREQDIDDDNDYEAAALAGQQEVCQEIEGDDEDEQGNGRIFRPTLKICRCEKWNFSHTNCFLQVCLNNRFECKKCQTETLFKTNRVFDYQNIVLNFKQKKVEILGTLKVVGYIFTIFSSFSSYFIYQLMTKELSNEFLIQVCSFVSFLALFLNGVRYFIKQFDLLCVKCVSPDLEFKDMTSSIEQPQLVGEKIEEKSQDIKSEDTSPQIINSPIQSEIFSPKPPQQQMITSPTASTNAKWISQKNQYSAQALKSQVQGISSWMTDAQQIQAKQAIQQIDPTMISQIPSRNLFGASIISRTTKRSVTLNEESPISSLNSIGGIQNKLKKTGSCLKNASSSQSGSSGNSKTDGNQKNTSKHSQTSSPSEEKSSEHDRDDQNPDNMQGSRYSRPFEGSGTKTCRFGASSTNLQASILGMSFAPTPEGLLSQNTPVSNSSFTNHFNRWSQLQQAFKKGGAFFSPLDSIKNVEGDNIANSFRLAGNQKNEGNEQKVCDEANVGQTCLNNQQEQ